MSDLDYTQNQRHELETTLSKQSNTLNIVTFVKPDAIVLGDSSEKTIRISKGKQENTTFIEFNGQTKTVATTQTTRYESIKKTLQKIAEEYSSSADLYTTVEKL